ncbi:hypothetical protein JB92DRAFT_3103191 [Gautieria morchelliformis]|nr:hypothetical protein JB92DRAFT_3103191 [Gautieria morchelliformis]
MSDIRSVAPLHPFAPNSSMVAPTTAGRTDTFDSHRSEAIESLQVPQNHDIRQAPPTLDAYPPFRSFWPTYASQPPGQPQICCWGQQPDKQHSACVAGQSQSDVLAHPVTFTGNPIPHTSAPIEGAELFGERTSQQNGYFPQSQGSLEWPNIPYAVDLAQGPSDGNIRAADQYPAQMWTTHQMEGICDLCSQMIKHPARHWLTCHAVKELKQIDNHEIEMSQAMVITTDARKREAIHYESRCRFRRLLDYDKKIFRNEFEAAVWRILHAS